MASIPSELWTTTSERLYQPTTKESTKLIYQPIATTSDSSFDDGGAIVQSLPPDPRLTNTYSATTTSSAGTTASTTTPYLCTISMDSDYKPSGHHDRGAVAGIAVGAASGAAIFVFLLTFFYMQKRSSRSRKDMLEHKYEKPDSADGYPNLAASINRLPQPMDDNSIKMAMRTLYQQIELHVENFYQENSVPESRDSMDSFLSLTSTTSPMPSSKLVAIKQALAHLILTHISADHPPATSFLPPEFTSLAQSVDRNTNHNTGPSESTQTHDIF